MSRSLSNPRLRTGFAFIIGGLVLAAIVFYAIQNTGVLPGGQIAPIKLAWLGCAILFWYLLPGLLLLDGRMPRAARRACIVLLVNMILRGIVELFMMYVTEYWHPWMGISHDIFMLVLMSAVLIHAGREKGGPYTGYLTVATAMFIPESGFAWYMLTYATDPGAMVYFVSGDPGHGMILAVTAIFVIALLGYLIFFYKEWLYGQTRRQLL